METKNEYALMLKIDWTSILSIFSKRKGHLMILDFGIDRNDNYVDWFILVFGIGIALRKQGSKSVKLKMSEEQLAFIFVLSGVLFLSLLTHLLLALM